MWGGILISKHIFVWLDSIWDEVTNMINKLLKIYSRGTNLAMNLKLWRWAPELGNGRWSQPKSQKSPLFSVPLCIQGILTLLKISILYKRNDMKRKQHLRPGFEVHVLWSPCFSYQYTGYIYIYTYYRIYCPPLVEFLAHLNMYHRIINIISIVSHIYIHMICIIFPTGLIPVTKKNAPELSLEL